MTGIEVDMRYDDYEYFDGWTSPGTEIWYSGRSRFRCVSDDERDQYLAPLVQQLAEYDRLRTHLQKKGGKLSDLERITSALTKRLSLDSGFTKSECSLADPKTIRTALVHAGLHDVRLQARKLQKCGMPGYYLARTRTDFWNTYSLIVEDLYRSPDYVLTDERFAKLVFEGHDSVFLRLAPFRGAVLEMLPPEERDPQAVDRLLCRVGHNIFSAAWHDDQVPAALLARELQMPDALSAVELVYLTLSAELTKLRDSASDERIRTFFSRCYPQPAIHKFLTVLPQLDGKILALLPEIALGYYRELSRAFHQFLSVKIAWNSSKLPLFKVVFSNVSRMDEVGRTFRDDPSVRKSASALLKTAAGVIDGIVAVAAAI